MFDLEHLKKLLHDIKALPDGWHPEPESIFRVLQSSNTSQNLLTIKDGEGVVVCIIPNNHLVDCQIELASAIAIWRKVIPFLILDTIARDIRLNEIRELCKSYIEDVEKDQSQRGEANCVIVKINEILNRKIEEQEIEKQEPETPGGIEPA